MTEGAGTEGTRCMANAAILGGRHVGIERGANWHAACCTRAISNMAGEATVTHDAGMIDAKCRSETLGVMARTAIGAGGWMAGHRG